LLNRELYNKKSKAQLKDKIKCENFNRVTCSFYKYTELSNLNILRDELYLELNNLDILGRIYIAEEGINAQISIPDYNLKSFKDKISSYDFFKGIDIKFAVVEGLSFYKLVIKIKSEIVAYKLSSDQYDMHKVGEHLNYKDFNKAIDEGAIIVDVRNYYEGEVGRFKNAIVPDVDASIELLPEIKRLLKNKKDEKILMYCTGGIRCEKASSYLIHHGFKDVNQLKGGIIQYANDIKENEVESKFIGKNFVFDHRLGERITDSIIGGCHQCEKKADSHTNCANQACHILFIQCQECKRKYNKCCSIKCSDFIKLPRDEQRAIFKEGKVKFSAQKTHKIKPKLKDIEK